MPMSRLTCVIQVLEKKRFVDWWSSHICSWVRILSKEYFWKLPRTNDYGAGRQIEPMSYSSCHHSIHTNDERKITTRMEGHLLLNEKSNKVEGNQFEEWAFRVGSFSFSSQVGSMAVDRRRQRLLCLSSGTNNWLISIDRSMQAYQNYGSMGPSIVRWDGPAISNTSTFSQIVIFIRTSKWKFVIRRWAWVFLRRSISNLLKCTWICIYIRISRRFIWLVWRISAASTFCRERIDWRSMLKVVHFSLIDVFTSSDCFRHK